MAGGIVLLSFMTFFMELGTIVPIHGAVQLASNSTRSLALRKNIEFRILIPSLFGLTIGTVIATQIIQSFANKEVFYFVVAALIFYVLFKPKKLPALIIPYWSFGILSVFVGILNPLIGATGPMMAPFYLRNDLSKETIVATKAATQTFGHFLKIPAFIYLGFDYQEYGFITILMIFAVIIGTRYGVKLLKIINEDQFRLIYRVALFSAGCRVFYKALISVS